VNNPRDYAIPLEAATDGRPTSVPAASALATLPDRNVTSNQWRELAVSGNAVPLSELLPAPGELTALQTWIQTHDPISVRLAVDCTMSTQVFVDGNLVLTSTGPRLVRPSYGVSEEVNQVVTLKVGFTEVVVLVEGEAAEPAELHVYLSTPDRLRHGIVDLSRTRFPWDQG